MLVVAVILRLRHILNNVVWIVLLAYALTALNTSILTNYDQFRLELMLGQDV